ncbi:MAG: ABC transporter permease, partial [Blastocatellia bacterium]
TQGDANAPEVKAALEKYYPGNYVLLGKDLPAFYSQPIGPVQVFLKVVIGLSVIISTLVIMLTMHTTITERTREIGILKSLGASSQFIISSIEKEALMISGIGVLFGFVVARIAKQIMEAHTRLLIDIDLKWLTIAALIGLAAGIIGAFYPAITAARLDPVDALSYE